VIGNAHRFEDAGRVPIILGVGVGVGAVVDIGIGVFLYQQPQEVPGPIDERNRQIGRRFKIVSDLEEPGEPLLAGAV